MKYVGIYTVFCSHALHFKVDNVFFDFLVDNLEKANSSLESASLAIVLDGGREPSVVGNKLLEDNQRREKSVWLLEDSRESLDIIEVGGLPFDSKIFLGRVENATENGNGYLYLKEIYKVSSNGT